MPQQQPQMAPQGQEQAPTAPAAPEQAPEASPAPVEAPPEAPPEVAQDKPEGAISQMFTAAIDEIKSMITGDHKKEKEELMKAHKQEMTEIKNDIQEALK